MLATLILFVLPAVAGTSDAIADRVSNRLEVEVAMQSQGILAEASGVVFSSSDASVAVKYDPMEGGRRIAAVEANAVGFVQLANGTQSSSAIFRSATSEHLCTRVSVRDGMVDQTRLAVYNARGEDLENSDQAQIVFGRDQEGQNTMAVWIRPGETVTSVSAVDTRSGRKSSRMELRRGHRMLVLSGDEAEAEACTSEVR